MMGPYDLGQTVQMTVTITDPTTGAAYDPTTVVFKVVAPGSSTVISPAVVKVSTGVYYAQQVVTVAGDWWYRVDTTGPAGGVERKFTVNVSMIPGG
jgi:hypothetical protein